MVRSELKQRSWILCWRGAAQARIVTPGGGGHWLESQQNVALGGVAVVCRRSATAHALEGFPRMPDTTSMRMAAPEVVWVSALGLIKHAWYNVQSRGGEGFAP